MSPFKRISLQNYHTKRDEEEQEIERFPDLFARVKSTAQAEMIATILYAYDQLVQKQSSISDKDLFDYVIQWKPHWKEPNEFALCDTIQNMAMLSLIKISCSGQLMDTTLV